MNLFERLSTRTVFRLALVCLLLALGACAEEADDELAMQEPDPGIPYTVEFQGPIDPELSAMLDRASDAKRGEEQPPVDELVLTQRALRDVGNLTRAMQSLGYYDGQVEWRLEDAPADGTDVENAAQASDPLRPRELIFTLQPGQRYRLNQPRIEAVGPDTSAVKLPSPEELGLVDGAPVNAEAILSAEQRLVDIVRRQSRPLVKIGQRSAEIDPTRGTLDLVLSVEPGPAANFGAITFTGIEGIDEGFLRARLSIHENEPYSPDALEESRRDLVDTQLFSTVRVITPDQLDETGRLPVQFVTSQRAPRSIAAGASYRTDEGPGVSASWEHRNYFGAGERVAVSALISAERYALVGQFRKPDFLARQQSLLIDSSIKHEDVEAYTSDSIQIGTAIERRLGDRLTGTLGVSYRLSNVEQEGSRETYGLVSFPAGLNWDTTDNFLDPTTGGRLVVNAGPYFDTLGSGAAFVKAQGTYSHYLSLTDDRRFVLALRGSIGTITAQNRDDVPPDERFYAGGGGSVRGIGYQLASPLDADDDPLGGLSLVEVNSEIRWRINETFGLVAFIDAGSAFDDPVPLSGGELQVGTGIGARYYTPIGPVRLDVAVPVHRRSGIDDAFQVYVSIGQAF
ncbi:MAG TPA: autotransporter assembly complex family protein [Geminicoccus sp.]|uniref:autotransporter assembly complex protein TamA n=1 Tax=Geminicoccus sp. TaxID=2024832 RepID=UPI002E2F9939|nr:autotransporter assembly complex family protein [Geminicoccus sp.]HEX2524952.1 autotransporter assembly complex family protein [Geminicoccus sp.]